jgi:hypothetical protein
MRVDFTVPGFSKCGTTTLCFLLNQHPDIFLPLREADFFGTPGYAEHWDVYEKLFQDSQAGQIIGENSSRYTSFYTERLACSQIFEHFPNIKFIFIARDPLDRLESSFREMHHVGPQYGFNTPFELYAAMRERPSIIKDARYWQKINLYRQQFSDEQIHVIFLEDLRAEPQAVISSCFEFLGVDPKIPITDSDRQLNSGGTKLYDSRLLRFLRSNRWSGIPLSKIPVNTQNKLFSSCGLRRKSGVPILWEERSRQLAHEVLFDECTQFLQHYGKSPDFWPRLQSLAEDAS